MTSFKGEVKHSIKPWGGKYVIVSIEDFWGITSHLSEVKSSLSEIGYRGYVLFDNVAAVGLSSNRLMSCSFDGEEFDVNSFQVARGCCYVQHSHTEST